jgi:hypothetical protein
MRTASERGEPCLCESQDLELDHPEKAKQEQEDSERLMREKTMASLSLQQLMMIMMTMPKREDDEY